jgi:uncharacterized heparinase superfamily protein
MPAVRRQSLFSKTRFHFLNEEREVATVANWDSSAVPKLWLYNLHYFDDLNACDADSRRAWHADLMGRWIVENLPGRGVGWEPYPLSLRIVNWMKWALAGNALNSAVMHSLAVQARFLAGRLEVHLLGNHLLANAKALVFAGVFFEGAEADKWLRLGMSILIREIPEQILPDGGHFERSTMYHALAFEDLLDLVNLARTFPAAFSSWHKAIACWPALAADMGRWLVAMCHPDGEISFFNDAALGIAASPDVLLLYACRLNISVERPVSDGAIWLKDSGYVRVQKNGAVLIVDVARIGPDYLPGHAHADTLSFEFSLSGQRVVVNSGTSRYGAGPERKWERSTAAHNTVEVNGHDSSEVWGGFRVARRAYPFDIAVEETADQVCIEAAHDGYRRLRGSPIHRRLWILGPQRLEVVDHVEGEYDQAVSHIYFHPEVHVEKVAAGGTVAWAGGAASWSAAGGEARVLPFHWRPQFGLSVPSACVELNLTGEEARFSLDWM